MKHKRIVFIIRQVIIIAVLMGIVFLKKDTLDVNSELNVTNTVIPLMIILKYILMVLVVTKPANAVFKAMFPDFGLSNDNNNEVSAEQKHDVSEGAIIGNLERILVVILLIFNQFGAIGLVIAAKSITRYKKISDDSSFAEYYLIGTLFSILSAIIVYGLITICYKYIG